MQPRVDIADLKKKFKHYTVLLVDDSIELRRVIVTIFLKLGFNVLEADGGRRALELIQKNRINAVLSDIRMPDGDGLELLANIRKLDPTFPVVVLMSGFTDITSEEAIRRGAVTILNKPSPGKVLVSTLIKAMNDATLSLEAQAREAVANGQLDKLKLLVERDFDLLFKPDSFGDLFIHLAIEKKQWNTVRFLVEKESDLILEKNRDQVTPIHLIAEKAQWDLLKFMLAKLIARPIQENPRELKLLLEFLREKRAPAETLAEFSSFVNWN